MTAYDSGCGDAWAQADVVVVDDDVAPDLGESSPVSPRSLRAHGATGVPVLTKLRSQASEPIKAGLH